MPIYKVDGARRNGLQKYRVIISYNSITGRRVQIERTAYGMDAAKDMEYQLLAEYKKGTNSAVSMSIKDLYSEYIRAKKHELRASSLGKKQTICRNHILPELGDVRIKKINTAVLQRWKEYIENKNLSIKMRQNIYTELRALFSYAVKMDYLPANPLTKVGNFKDAYQAKTDIDYYTLDEFAKFITAAHDAASQKGLYEHNYLVFFSILFYLGLRKGEANALRWTDLKGNVIHIRRSISQKLGGGDVETPPKNASSNRDLILPEPLMELITKHYRLYSKVDGFCNSWRICGGINCLRDSSISNRNIQYSTTAGIKTIRIHDFRHSHASLLANEGINIQEIARRLGHTNIEITLNTYLHLYPREEERALKVLNSILPFSLV